MSATDLHAAIEQGDATRVTALLASPPALATARDAAGVSPVM